MVLPINVQLYYFFSTIVAGLFVGIMFDIYRILRGFNCPNKILTAVSDILFWVLAAIIIFILFLYTNNGDLRYYTFIGLILGLFLYFEILSKKVIIVLRTIVYIFLKLIRLLVICVIYPFKVVTYYIRYTFYLIRRLIQNMKLKHKKKCIAKQQKKDKLKSEKPENSKKKKHKKKSKKNEI